jgi:hypothetical protein
MAEPNQYFRVDRDATALAGPRWRSAATIVRGDTEEPVAHLNALGETASAADAQLDAEIERTLATLEKPGDWGRDPTVFRLLRAYLRHRERLYGIVEQAREADEAHAAALRADAEACEREDLRALNDQISRLTEAQLLELATPTDEQLAQREDPWTLDTLTAKKRLCLLAFSAGRRSPAIQAAYEGLDRALNS